MPILWKQGKDQAGYNWLSAVVEGEVTMPRVHWREGDPPKRFRFLATQALTMAQEEMDRVRQLETQIAVHKLQALAYMAIAEALQTGQPITVVIKPEIEPERPEPVVCDDGE